MKTTLTIAFILISSLCYAGEVYLYTTVYDGDSFMKSERYEVKDIEECKKLVENAKVIYSNGDESEGGFLVFCAGGESEKGFNGEWKK